MRSRNIRQPEVAANQMTLSFEPDVHERYRSLRECIATGVYQRGLGKVAIDLDTAPSNLSVQLSEDPSRKFSVDSLETYLEKTGDHTPILYLVSKFMAPDDQPDVNAKALLSQMLALAKQAGLA
jgi:hypothetical protein